MIVKEKNGEIYEIIIGTDSDSSNDSFIVPDSYSLKDVEEYCKKSTYPSRHESYSIDDNDPNRPFSLREI